MVRDGNLRDWEKLDPSLLVEIRPCLEKALSILWGWRCLRKNRAYLKSESRCRGADPGL